MEHVIERIVPGSIAEELGLEPSDVLEAINGETIYDTVDYEYCCAQEELTLHIRKKNGEQLEAKIEKDSSEGLGLQFKTGLMSAQKSCANNCVFCFVDQLPKNVRSTLHVKDDDWRLSFIMGNYITLTNVGDCELARICDRRVSPLYISVHTTDPDLRIKMLGSHRAGRILHQLNTLADAKIRFHCQIVLCPELNDGEALERTLEDLWTLYPAAQSVALVPVGLTAHREGLDPLLPFDKEKAKAALERVKVWQRHCLKEEGTAFVFAADELYLTAGEEMPSAYDYEGYPQIENGVGLLRKFEEEFYPALEDAPQGTAKGKHFTIITGVSAAPWFTKLANALCAHTGAAIEVIPAVNRFFGESVTVAGLLTGSDLLAAVDGKGLQGKVLISQSMLRDDCFLDDKTLDEISEALRVPVIPVWVDGAELVSAVLEE